MPRYGELRRDRRHEGMVHARAGAVRQHVAGARVRRHLQQAGHADGVVDRDCDGLCVVHDCKFLQSAVATRSGNAYISCRRADEDIETMCRNIRTLFNFAPPATDDEIRAAALQFVRKLSGYTRPARVNEPAFNRAIDEIAAAAGRLLTSLETSQPAARSRRRSREGQGAGEGALRSGGGRLITPPLAGCRRCRPGSRRTAVARARRSGR